MNYKTFLFALLVAASLFFSGSFKDAKAASPSLSSQQSISEDDYYYVYNEINGVTWVFVYDKDGNLVTCYPLE